MSTQHPTLRLTPSNSPFFKNNNSPRSPTKAFKNHEEPGLQLRRVIGTTTESANGFDCLPSAHCFAFTAGAAAVVSTIGEGLNVTQRFFRARPVNTGTSRDVASTWAVSPSPLEPRHRALGSVREQSLGSPLAASTNTRDWSDSPNTRSSTAKDRVKAAASVSLSANGKWLAIGETGYKPRVLVFSLSEGSSETPVASMCEHHYGVHCLSFSPDSRLLASLGTVNDGFLYLWSINDRTGSADLVASNKLTTLVNSMTWMGRSLITAGLRFVKVWRPDDIFGYETNSAESNSLTPRPRTDNSRMSEFGKSVFSPKHKTLHGKNALLGDLLECNFISILQFSDGKAVVCAQSGEVCVLDDTGKAQRLTLIALADFTITCARLQDDELYVLGAGGESRLVRLVGAEKLDPSRTKRQTLPSARASSHLSTAIIYSTLVEGVLVELTHGRVITLSHHSDSSEKETNAEESIQLPAHREAILGVKPITSNVLQTARFLTFSGDGSTHFWDKGGNLVKTINLAVPSIPEWQSQPNEVKAMAPDAAGATLIIGDKYGVLKLLDLESQNTIGQLRAHSAEILDIAVTKMQDSSIIATAGRDRMVQLFTVKGKDIELLQTLEEHAGVVHGVVFAQDGQRLISYSSDRTVVIREVIPTGGDHSMPLAYASCRTIVLKTSPVSLSIASDHQLWVATVDRSVARYSIKDGQCTHTFKCSDNDGGEAVALSKIKYLESLNGMPCIAGVCTSDKSVRLYTEHGSLLARDWGHTEGITDLALVQVGEDTTDTSAANTHLVTVAADSTMFIWHTAPNRNSRRHSIDGLSEGGIDASLELPLGPPVRRVLSHTELSRFRRQHSMDESEPSSPTSLHTPVQPSSPQRLRKKTSRILGSQAPRLEPSFKAATKDTSRRKSVNQRSPSPTSPRVAVKKRDAVRRKSMAGFRSKSSENVVKEGLPSQTNTNNSGFGSLTASAETICRSLRTYRKKLSTSTEDALAPETVRELDRELKLTLRALSERSQGNVFDEASVTKLLEQASEKIVEMLDDRIKERVENEVHRKSSASSPGSSIQPSVLGPPLELERSVSTDIESLAGALEAASLSGRKVK